MRGLAAGGLLGAFACLALAALTGDPYWRWALVGVMGCLSAGVLGLAGLLLARVLPRHLHLLACGLTAGVAAALTRRVFMAMLRARGADAPPQIEPARLFAAVFTLVGGALALLWGCAVLRRLVAESDEHPEARTWPRLLLAGTVISLGLYGVSPVGQALGLRVNHWTFLGLVALALLAYAVEAAFHRLLGGRRNPVSKNPSGRRRRGECPARDANGSVEGPSGNP